MAYQEKLQPADETPQPGTLRQDLADITRLPRVLALSQEDTAKHSASSTDAIPLANGGVIHG